MTIRTRSGAESGRRRSATAARGGPTGPSYSRSRSTSRPSPASPSAGDPAGSPLQRLAEPRRNPSGSVRLTYRAPTQGRIAADQAGEDRLRAPLAEAALTKYAQRSARAAAPDAPPWPRLEEDRSRGQRCPARIQRSVSSAPAGVAADPAELAAEAADPGQDRAPERHVRPDRVAYRVGSRGIPRWVQPTTQSYSRGNQGGRP